MFKTPLLVSQYKDRYRYRRW